MKFFVLSFQALIIILSILGCVWIFSDIYKRKKMINVNDDLARLCKATQLLSSRINEASGKDFWEKIGKPEPMRDPWGQPYFERKLSRSGTIVNGWGSSGPDRERGTQDDLYRSYEAIENYDFTRPDLDSPNRTTTVR